MGVLDARANAEKVTYPVVGETKKDASNVIDYNIQEEITTDTSAVFNANNDTTTGMATVIPGVNAPKLKMSTSIYMDKEIVIPTVNQTLYGDGSVYYPSDPSVSIRNMTSQSSYGNNEIVYFNSPQGATYSGMKIPASGNYKIYARYKYSGSSYGWVYEWRLAKGGGTLDDMWHSYSTAWDNQYEYETIVQHFDKGDVFFVFVTMVRSTSSALAGTPDILIEIEKLL